jgi:hypothetical protein
VFTALAVLLLVSGAALAGSMSHRRLRTVWIVFGVICAVIYPPAAPAWEVPVNVQQHVSGLMDEVESLVVRRFEAEQLPSSLDRTSRVADEGASGGFIRRSAVTRPSELVLYGPYLNLPAGRYRVEWTLKLEAPAPEDVIAGVDVVSEADRTTRLAHRWVTRAEVGTEGFTRVTAEFASAVPLKGVEFRLFSEKDVVLRVDHVELIPLRAALRRGWFTGSR